MKTVGKTAIAQFNLFSETAYEGSIDAAQEKKFLEEQRHLASLEPYGEAMVNITQAVHLDPSRPGKYQRVVVPAGGTVLRAMNIKGEPINAGCAAEYARYMARRVIFSYMHDAA